MSNEHPGAERAVVAYGSAVRTALRNNATAYGFSISVTATFSLAMTACCRCWPPSGRPPASPS